MTRKQDAIADAEMIMDASARLLSRPSRSLTTHRQGKGRLPDAMTTSSIIHGLANAARRMPHPRFPRFLVSAGHKRWTRRDIAIGKRLNPTQPLHLSSTRHRWLESHWSSSAIDYRSVW